MRQVRKSIAFLAVLLLTFSLIGCGSTTKSATGTTKTEKNQEAVKQDVQSKEEHSKEPQEKAKNTSTKTLSVVVKEKTSEKKVVQDPKTENTKSVQSKPSTIKQNPTTTTKKKTTSSTEKKAIKNKPNTNADPKPLTKPKTQKAIETVTFSVVGPKDRGTIIGASKIQVKDGDTIFDLLQRTTKQHQIQVDSRGSGATAYIEGIDNIYEFDYGVKSGWVFKLNGMSLTKSIGVIKVKAGDRVQCIYTE